MNLPMFNIIILTHQVITLNNKNHLFQTIPNSTEFDGIEPDQYEDQWIDDDDFSLQPPQDAEPLEYKITGVSKVTLFTQCEGSERVRTYTTLLFEPTCVHAQ